MMVFCATLGTIAIVVSSSSFDWIFREEVGSCGTIACVFLASRWSRWGNSSVRIGRGSFFASPLGSRSPWRTLAIVPHRNPQLHRHWSHFVASSIADCSRDHHGSSIDVFQCRRRFALFVVFRGLLFDDVFGNSHCGTRCGQGSGWAETLPRGFVDAKAKDSWNVR